MEAAGWKNALRRSPWLPPNPMNSSPKIHDRLALILHPRDYERWVGIDDKGGDPRPPLDLLHPYDVDKMVMKPANPAVGNWRNNGPEMLDRT
jgi:putative SOS response-associated peptidase YedK